MWCKHVKMAKISTFSVNYGRAANLSTTCSSDKHASSILVTINTKTVSVVNLSGNRVEKEWSLRSGTRFTTPACFNHHDDQYYAVLDNKNLCSWKGADDRIDKCGKVKISKPAHKLFSAGQKLLVLFTDGTYALAAQPSTIRGQIVISSDEEILWADMCSTSKSTVLAFLAAEKGKRGGNVKAHMYTFTRDMEHAEFYSCQLQHNDCDWLSSCIQVKDNLPNMVTLWSNGDLTRQPLDNSLSHIEELAPIKSLDTKLASLSAVDDSQVAICGIRTTEGVCVGLWDVNFGLLRASSPILHEAITHAKLSCWQNKLLLISDKGLYLASYLAAPSTLCGVLGKLTNDGQTRIATQDTNHDASKTSHLLHAADVLVANATSNQFEESFGTFITLFNSQPKDALLLCRQQITALLRSWREASTAVKSKWAIPTREVEQLIDARLITGSELQLLFPLLTSQDHVMLLHACVLHVRDIPEVCMVQAVQSYLKCDESMLEKCMADRGITQGEQSPTSSLHWTKAHLINAVVRLRMNDAYLQQSLRELSFTTALELLNYLHHLLCAGTAQQNLPSVNQVSDWLNCVLDAHFTQLILSPDARAFLVELHQTVQNRVQCLEEMNCLEALLGQIKERYEMPQIKHMGHYCIETLHI